MECYSEGEAGGSVTCAVQGPMRECTGPAVLATMAVMLGVVRERVLSTCCE